MTEKYDFTQEKDNLRYMQDCYFAQEKIFFSILFEKKELEIFPYFDMDIASANIKDIQGKISGLSSFCDYYQFQIDYYQSLNLSMIVDSFTTFLKQALDLRVKFEFLLSQFTMYFLGQSKDMLENEKCVQLRLEKIHNWLVSESKNCARAFNSENDLRFFYELVGKLQLEFYAAHASRRNIELATKKLHYIQRIMFFLKSLKNTYPYSFPEYQNKFNECSALACNIENLTKEYINKIYIFSRTIDK